MGAVAHVLAVDPVPARSQMGSSLGFHIILACFGIAFAAVTMTAEWIGIRRGDAAALLLARRWSKVMAVLVAVGAVSGTVLSYEMGLLWPGLMGRFGSAIGFPFSVEGIFFFLEAIFVGIYLYGWRRLSPWAHWWSGMPIVVAGVLGALSVVAANSWMNSPAGYTLSHGKVTSVEPGVGVFQRRDPVRDRAHGARRVHGDRIPRRRRVRGGAAARPPGPLPPAGLRRPVHDCRDLGPAAGDDGGHHRPVHRPQPAGQVRRDGIRPRDHPRRCRMGGRDPHQRPRLLRRRRPVVRLDLGRVLAAYPGHRLGQRAPGAAAAASHAHPPELRPDGGPRLLPVRAGGVAGLVVVVPPPAAGDRVVPGALCPRRRGRGRRDGGGVGRHRGRPPAVDRLPRPAGQRRGYPGQRGPGHAGGDPRPVRDLDGGLDRRSDDHVAAVAAGSARRRGGRAGAVRSLAGQAGASPAGPPAPPGVPRASSGGPDAP